MCLAIVLINMVTILIISAKIATPVLLKIRVFCNNGYDVIIYVHDLTNKILSRDSNHIIDVIIWLKCGNCYHFYEKSYHNLNFIRIWPENCFFEEWSLFKFNNVGLALCTNLKFCTSVTKGLKLKVRKFWGQILHLQKLQGENW